MSVFSGTIISGLSVRFFYTRHYDELQINNQKNSDILAASRNNARNLGTFQNQSDEMYKNYLEQQKRREKDKLEQLKF